jgi:hypothetical protein
MNVRSISRRCAVALAVAGLALGSAAVPATASVGGRVLVATACITTPTAKFAPAPDGLVRGFIETGCHGDSIDYVTDNPASPSWREVSTPYKGQVLATVQDAQATYLLYRATDGVRITKVLHDGTMTHGNVLSPATGGGLEGTLAARGGGWFAVWTEPKAGGGFALHGKGSVGWTLSPSARMFPAGAGVDDSAPVLSKGSGRDQYTLAWSRHDSTGFHLMYGSSFHSPWTHFRRLDSTTENPSAASTTTGSTAYLAWTSGSQLRLGDTIGAPMHRVPVAQPPAGSMVTAPQVAVDCGRLYVAYQVDTENSGTIYVDTLFKGAWVRHTVRVATASAPMLAGVAPHCSSGAVLWTEAGQLYAVMVA